MIAPVAKFLDWLAIQALNLRPLREDGHDLRLEEALEFLRGPDFLPDQSQPARVEFNPDPSGRHFKFPSPMPCEFPENNIVYGRLYRCTRRWRERPVVVLLHGEQDLPNHRLMYPWIARRLNRAGFNAATLELPYHFQRHSRGLGGLDYLRVAESFAQGVAEIRALTGWLLGNGCPSVALWGVSLGAWLAGLAVCSDARLAAAVMHASPARFDNLLSQGKHVVWRSRRELRLGRRAAYDALDMTRLNLRCSQPLIPKENILLIGGVYDIMVSSGPNELWETWRGAEIWRLPHGHIGIGSQLVPGVTDRVFGWLAPRLNADATFLEESNGSKTNGGIGGMFDDRGLGGGGGGEIGK